jgi:hypothetical protein
MDGNAMYLGAMAFPADLMDAQGMLVPCEFLFNQWESCKL